MKLSIGLFGKGGFGVHTLGRVIRTAIIKDDASLYVALAIDYDTVVKGGVSNCDLIISDKQCNPVVEWKPDIGINICASWAVLRTCDGTFYLSIPSGANRYISENVRGYVLLGMLVARGHMPVSKEAVKVAIEAECSTSRMVILNKSAFEKGLKM